MLTHGKISKAKATLGFLEGAGRIRYILIDKGYDTDRLRRLPREIGTIRVIPDRHDLKRVIRSNQRRYCKYYITDNTFCLLKDFSCVTIRRQITFSRSVCYQFAFWL